VVIALLRLLSAAGVAVGVMTWQPLRVAQGPSEALQISQAHAAAVCACKDLACLRAEDLKYGERASSAHGGFLPGEPELARKATDHAIDCANKLQPWNVRQGQIANSEYARAYDRYVATACACSDRGCVEAARKALSQATARVAPTGTEGETSAVFMAQMAVAACEGRLR
jgi:hypothetical protein